MKSFQGTNDEYVASIAVDASTIGNVTVAVAAYATRHEEVDILDGILTSARSMGVTFVPFKSKSHHFDKHCEEGFFERIIERNQQRLWSLYFRHSSSARNQHYVESVLTAIAVTDVFESTKQPAFVLVDGDERKVADFARAFTGLGESPPDLSNCFQSELYYPHALLADLSAGYLAKQLDSGEYDYVDPVLRTAPADRIRSDEWGTAFDYLRTNPGSDYQRLDLTVTYAETERERAKAWFQGSMGRRPANASPSISMTTIVAHLEKSGYESVGERLRKL